MCDKNMKILLTGGFGYLGQTFIKKYKKFDYVIFSRKKPKNYEKFDGVIELGNVENHTIFDVIKKHKPDIVIHLAALSGLKKCESDPSKAFLTNVLGTMNVAMACSSEQSKLIFLSSREIYGETLNEQSSEIDFPSPVNVYGLTKYLSEKIIEFYAKTNNLNYLILRLTNVYGDNGERRGVNRIIDTALNENTIQINGNGNQTLNLIFVEDVVDIIKQFIDNPNISNEIFNVGSDDTITLNQFCDLVSTLLPQKITKQYFPKIPYENEFFKPNIDKLKKLLDFNLKFNLEKGLQKTMEFYSQKI